MDATQMGAGYQGGAPEPSRAMQIEADSQVFQTPPGAEFKPGISPFEDLQSSPPPTEPGLAAQHEELREGYGRAVAALGDRNSMEMDLRTRGTPVPPLAALDRDGFVVLLHSFSKSLFPGLRAGSIVARGRAVDGLVALKHATDLSDSSLLQAALAEFIEDGAYDRDLGRIRRELRLRHEAVEAALAASMPEGTRWTRPEGGYQVWAELPFAVDTRELLADASRAGVLFSPGAHFLPDGRAPRALRLTLARANAAQIEWACARSAA